MASVKIHTNLQECKELWDLFSPKENIFDEWDFCMAWVKGMKYKPEFHVLYNRNKPVAVLPLCFDQDDRRYEWFGGEWMEDHIFFGNIRDIKVLLTQAPTPLMLNSIKYQKGLNMLKSVGTLQLDHDPRNELSIQNLHTPEDLIASLKKKRRYLFKRDIENIKAQNPKINIKYKNTVNAFESMLTLNKRRFNGTDRADSYVEEANHAFRNMLKSTKFYKTYLIEVKINNKVVAVDMVGIYKSTYYLLTGSADLSFEGINNYMLYIDLQDAIKNNCYTVDALQEDYNWKHKVFDQIPVYLFEK